MILKRVVGHLLFQKSKFILNLILALNVELSDNSLFVIFMSGLLETMLCSK